MDETAARYDTPRLLLVGADPQGTGRLEPAAIAESWQVHNVPPGQGFPGGGMGRPAGVDEETWNKAQSACAALQPSMGAFPGGGARPTP